MGYTFHMKILKNILSQLDKFQQRHRFTAFSHAVVKKYGEDNVGNQAALLTYYGFLSLFPLLMVLTTVLNNVLGNNSQLRERAIDGLTDYFPLLGDQLSTHVQSLGGSGFALVIGILFALYGARGVAEAFRKGVQHVWQIPESQRDKFPKSTLKSLTMLVVGGGSFILASLLAGWAASQGGHGLVIRGISVLLNVLILFLLFNFLINISLPRHLPLKQTKTGAIVAAIGLVLLQTLGGYILTRELRNLDALYSYFALALGLLFWIYLQAQIVCYAMVTAYVSSRKLWPRSLGPHKTGVDKQLAAARKKRAGGI